MYTNVEDLIIKPHDRYTPLQNFSTNVIMCHHPDYFVLADSIADRNRNFRRIECWEHEKPYRKKYCYNGVDFILDDARDNPKDSMRHVVQHYFAGARRIINIGAAGGIDPTLYVGDYVVGCQAVRDAGIDDNLASSDVIAESSACLTRYIEDAICHDTPAIQAHVETGDVWSVGNKYYTWLQIEAIQNTLLYDIKCVDMEMASICITGGWLNHNYSNDMGEVAVGNLFYISDILPRSRSEKWRDGMTDLQSLRHNKLRVLSSAMEALYIASTQTDQMEVSTTSCLIPPVP
jgi:hypothetical protein